MSSAAAEPPSAGGGETTLEGAVARTDNATGSAAPASSSAAGAVDGQGDNGDSQGSKKKEGEMEVVTGQPSNNGQEKDKDKCKENEKEKEKEKDNETQKGTMKEAEVGGTEEGGDAMAAEPGDASPPPSRRRRIGTATSPSRSPPCSRPVTPPPASLTPDLSDSVESVLHLVPPTLPSTQTFIPTPPLPDHVHGDSATAASCALCNGATHNGDVREPSVTPPLPIEQESRTPPSLQQSVLATHITDTSIPSVNGNVNGPSVQLSLQELPKAQVATIAHGTQECHNAQPHFRIDETSRGAPAQTITQSLSPSGSITHQAATRPLNRRAKKKDKKQVNHILDSDDWAHLSLHFHLPAFKKGGHITKNQLFGLSQSELEILFRYISKKQSGVLPCSVPSSRTDLISQISRVIFEKGVDHPPITTASSQFPMCTNHSLLPNTTNSMATSFYQQPHQKLQEIQIQQLRVSTPPPKKPILVRRSGSPPLQPPQPLPLPAFQSPQPASPPPSQPVPLVLFPQRQQHPQTQIPSPPLESSLPLQQVQSRLQPQLQTPDYVFTAPHFPIAYPQMCSTLPPSFLTPLNQQGVPALPISHTMAHVPPFFSQQVAPVFPPTPEIRPPSNSLTHSTTLVHNCVFPDLPPIHPISISPTPTLGVHTPHPNMPNTLPPSSGITESQLLLPPTPSKIETKPLLQSPPFQNPQFKSLQDPFWKEVKQLGAFQCTKGAALNQRFTIELPDWQKISEQKRFVHVRLFNRQPGRDLDPTSFLQSLTINSSNIILKRGAPPAKKKKTPEKDRPSPTILFTPTDITSSVLYMTNYIKCTPLPSFEPTVPNSVMIVFQLVKKNELAQIIEDIPISQTHRTSTTPNSSGDGDIQLVSSQLRLTCPLSLGRIKVPVRGTNCKHQQCMDASSFLLFCNQQRTWLCPVCGNLTLCSTLFIDTWFQEILSRVSEETVQLLPNGDVDYSTTTSVKEPEHPENYDDSEEDLPIYRKLEELTKKEQQKQLTTASTSTTTSTTSTSATAQHQHPQPHTQQPQPQPQPQPQQHAQPHTQPPAQIHPPPQHPPSQPLIPHHPQALLPAPPALLALGTGPGPFTQQRPGPAQPQTHPNRRKKRKARAPQPQNHPPASTSTAPTTRAQAPLSSPSKGNTAQAPIEID
ncbi:E3 SUMO-protein ligase PIAS1 [Pelomyxa schiedti]|nr:E3 SUMO-protein ligase PIAS1 [Pelomyxa schiedti]